MGPMECHKGEATRVSSRDDDLRALLQRVRAGTLAEDDLYQAIHKLGRVGLTEDHIYHAIHELGRAELKEAIPAIERFLTHDDPQYRYIALEVLTLHFHLPEHWTSAVHALRHDPDDHVRIGAASALCTLRRNTHDAATLHELARVVADENEDEFVRQTAWSAMLGVIKWDWQEQRRLARGAIDLAREVDWNFVYRYAPTDEDTVDS